MSKVIEIPSIDETNFKYIFFKWAWAKIKLSEVSLHYKTPQKRSAIAKIVDVFKIYLFDKAGNVYDLANKVLKNADLLANILPFEDNSQHEQSKAMLKAMVYYSTQLTNYGIGIASSPVILCHTVAVFIV